MSDTDASDYWEPYSARATVLRNWFMAYGIGALATILANDEVRRKILDSSNFMLVATLFLGGVMVQVFLALVYKHVMSYLYVVDEPDESNTAARKRYVCLTNFTHKIWPDLSADMATIICFASATWLVIRELAPP